MANAMTLLLLVVIYLRVSTEEQAKKGYSLPEQREACRQKAQLIARETEASTGRPVQLEIKEFVDDFGGDILERPKLEEMRSFVREHKPAWFVCMDPDRFSRSLKLQLIVADEIESQGTTLAFAQMDYDPDDMMSRAFFQFRGLMSELDKAKILERTTRGKRGKIRAGGRPNGACPYGYKHDKEKDVLVIYEPEAQWVRQMFRWIVDDQFSTYQITMRLNELGVPTKRGRDRWKRTSVAEVLRNTSYAGTMVCNRYDLEGRASVRRLPREKRQALTAKIRPKEEWKTVPVPPIIEQAIFEAAQVRLEITKRPGGRRDTGLLSMLVRCGSCGSPMGYHKHYQSERYYIRCRRRYADLHGYTDPTRCTNPHHRAERIEAEVWETLVTWLCKPSILQDYLEEQSTAPAAPGELNAVERELVMLQEQLDEKRTERAIIIRRQAQKKLTEEEADILLDESQEHMGAIERAIRHATDRLTYLRQQAAAATAAASRFRSLAEAIAKQEQEVREKLTTLTSDGRRKLALQLLKTVFIYPDGTWKAMPQ